MTQMTLQITRDNSINNTGTNYVHMGKNKIIPLPQARYHQQTLIGQALHLPGIAFLIWHSAIIGIVFPFGNIVYPRFSPFLFLPSTLPPSLEYRAILLDGISLSTVALISTFLQNNLSIMQI